MKLFREKYYPKDIRYFKITSTRENVFELSTIAQCFRKTVELEPKIPKSAKISRKYITAISWSFLHHFEELLHFEELIHFNPFVPNAPFLYPPKTSENLKIF